MENNWNRYSADLHNHTIASGHAYSTVMETVLSAKEKGIKLLGITEHAPKMPGTCDAMYFVNFRIVPEVIEGVEVLMGVELNIIDFDGKVDLHLELLKKMDLAIASFHPPCIRFGTIEENTNAVIKCCENPYINIIGHPDDDRYPLDYRRVAVAAKNTKTLLELNNASLTPGGVRENAKKNDVEMLQICKELEVPIIINSDSHFYSGVGANNYALDLIEELDFPKELVMNYNIDKLKEFLNKYK